MSEINTTAPPEQIWDGIFPAANPGATYSGGSGTEADPYLISNSSDLAQIASNVKDGNECKDLFFRMTNNIYWNTNSINPANVNPATPGSGGYPLIGSHPVVEWVPIGGAAAESEIQDLVYVFQGTFDGDNHKLFNVYYNHQVLPTSNIEHDPANIMNAVGIFGAIGSHCTIKNLETVGGYIAARNSVGGIVGRNWGGDVINCHNGNFVYAKGAQGTGGVVGASWTFIPEDGDNDPQKSPRVDKCSNSGTVISDYFNRKPEPSGAAGGIVGENEGNVTNSWNTGIVSCRKNAAGIVGSNQSENSTGEIIIPTPATINNCYNTGHIGTSDAYGAYIPAISALYPGGIIGFQTGSCQNAYNIGMVLGATGSAQGEIISELKIDTSEGAEPQTNGFLNVRTGHLNDVVGDIISGTLGPNVLEFGSTTTDQNNLRDDLNNWVNAHDTTVYSSWTRSASVNNGYPYFA